jgi:signal transduction histidine kinase
MNHDFEQTASGLAETVALPCAELPLTTERLCDWFQHLRGQRANREQAIRLEEQRRERTRIAQELEHTLFEGFLGASELLQHAVEEMPANEPLKSSANRVLYVVRRVLEEGRKTLAGLRSSDLRSTSLDFALAKIADEIAPGGTKVRISVLGRPRELPLEIAEEVFLVAREALVNALRHSEATSIEVEVEYLTRRLRLVVRDNGIGIDREVLERGRDLHWGLKGMRERAADIGAQLRILSRKETGTEVEVSVSTELDYAAGLTDPLQLQHDAVA